MTDFGVPGLIPYSGAQGANQWLTPEGRAAWDKKRRELLGMPSAPLETDQPFSDEPSWWDRVYGNDGAKPNNPLSSLLGTSEPFPVTAVEEEQYAVDPVLAGLNVPQSEPMALAPEAPAVDPMQSELDKYMAMLGYDDSVGTPEFAPMDERMAAFEALSESGPEKPDFWEALMYAGLGMMGEGTFAKNLGEAAQQFGASMLEQKKTGRDAYEEKLGRALKLAEMEQRANLAEQQMAYDYSADERRTRGGITEALIRANAKKAVDPMDMIRANDIVHSAVIDIMKLSPDITMEEINSSPELKKAYDMNYINTARRFGVPVNY